MKYKKMLSVVTALCIASSALIACTPSGSGDPPETDPDGFDLTVATPTNTDTYDIPQDYCRTYYEVFVRSFADGDGDGVGDFRGLIDNLDYLNDGDDSTTSDLGINGIWMMPINSSPSYHKYDVTDYYNIDDEYGTLNDFDELVAECEKRDIWLQMDLVLNHTSNKHPWFLQAVEDAQMGYDIEDSAAMQKYMIYLKSEKPKNDGGTYYDIPNSDYCYLGNFSSEMPDVNLANETVRTEIKNIVDFWLERGIRSFRLDAVPWAFENNTGYSEENGEFWTWFNDYCNKKGKEVYGEKYPGLDRYCYNVGEVLADTTSVEQFYITKMSNFNYGYAADPTSGFAGVVNGKPAASLIENLEEMQGNIVSADPDALFSNFLSGHDNDRSAGYFRSNLAKIKKAAGLYLLMPGNPYIYYGEEIGAMGSRGSNSTDANRRLHFNWGDSRETEDPVGSNYTGTQSFGSVLDQTENKDSILTYYRSAIKLRNRFPEIGRGRMAAYAVNSENKLLPTSQVKSTDKSLVDINALNKSIAAYTLEYNGKTTLIVQNVGSADARIDISEFKDKSVVAAVKADGGRVTVKDGYLWISGGVACVIK